MLIKTLFILYHYDVLRDFNY